MKRTIAIVALFLSTEGGAQNKALPEPTSEMGRAAADLAARFSSTWNAADGSAYGEAYWPDAELVDPSGRIWNGRAEIVETHVDLWRRGRSSARAIVRRVRPLSERLMVVDVTTTVCGFAQLPPGARADDEGCVWSNLKHVAEKRQDDWKITASQNTFTPPPR